ncbi:hypothetical protein KAR91_21950 [Candidatus Pacearchaeota archaeon]|nr:hypothetical protein [Candidatus Pacearchaeota archaeon]
MCPSDSDMIDERYHHFFIHKVFGNFYKDTLDYFSKYLYPRFHWTVVGTYDKAVEYITKTDELGREPDKINLPALILNPVGEFNVADATDGGKQLWRFPNLAPGMIKRIFDPLYLDENIAVNVGFSRFKGEIELIMLLNSFYEYCDLRVFLIQMFGGLERWIYPRWFTTFIILPEELLNYTYKNEYTNTSYQIDWDGNGANDQLIDTTAKTEKVVPCTIKPTFKLLSIGDGSNKYGGDRLAEWKLTITFEFQIEIPTTLILEVDSLTTIPPLMNFEIATASAFSEHAEYARTEGITLAPEHAYVTDGEITVNNRYYHLITQEQEDSETVYQIDLPEQITDHNLLKLQSKTGVLSYGDHYTLVNDGNSIEIKADVVDFKKDDVVEVYTYKKEVNPLGSPCTP